MHASSAPDEPGRGPRPGVTWEPFDSIGVPDEAWPDAPSQLSHWSPLDQPCVFLPIVAFTVIMGIAAIVVAVCYG